MKFKSFIIAVTFFAVVSLGAIFGITYGAGKVLIPPSDLETFVCRYLGDSGPVAVLITCFVLSTSMVLLLTRKVLAPRLP